MSLYIDLKDRGESYDFIRDGMGGKEMVLLFVWSLNNSDRIYLLIRMFCRPYPRTYRAFFSPRTQTWWYYRPLSAGLQLQQRKRRYDPVFYNRIDPDETISHRTRIWRPRDSAVRSPMHQGSRNSVHPILLLQGVGLSKLPEQSES